MRQSEKKILINNFLMLLLVVCGVVLLGVKDNALNLTVQRVFSVLSYSLSSKGVFDDSRGRF